MDIQFWHWLILGLVLLGLETLVPGTFFLWSGIAGLITGILSWLIPMPWQLQTVIFAVLSLASFFVFRKWWKGRKAEEVPRTLNRRGESYIGRRFTLAEPIINGIGRLNVDDSQWRVEGLDTPAGEQVEVTAVNGATLHVEATSAGNRPTQEMPA